MNKVINIHDYKKFKKVLKELPELLQLLNSLQQQLYNYMHYHAASHINTEINLAKENIELNLELVQKKLQMIKDTK